MDIILPKTKNAKEKFARIVEAGDIEFYQNGYEKTTIANITSAAGMAVGTFYLYFKDKLSLYHYILFDYQDRLRRYIQARIGSCNNRLEKEKLGLIAWLEFINDNPRTYTIIWQSLSIDKSLFVDYYSKFSKSYERGLKKDKDQLIDVDFETLSLALMGISSFLGLKSMLSNEKKLEPNEIEKIADDIIKVLKNGLFILKKD